jgi:hypothetical protein
VIGEDQIREHARFVDEAAETGDERHALERFAHAPGLRRQENRIRIVDNDDVDGRRAAGEEVGSKRGGRLRKWRWCLGRRELNAAWRADAARQCVQRVDGKRLLERIRMGERRPADDRDRGLCRPEVARELLDARRWHSGDALHLCGRILHVC